MKCRKIKIKNKNENKNPKLARKKNERTMLLSKCSVCDSKKSKFIKQLEASGLLSNFVKNTVNQSSFSSFSFVLEVLTS